MRALCAISVSRRHLRQDLVPNSQQRHWRTPLNSEYRSSPRPAEESDRKITRENGHKSSDLWCGKCSFFANMAELAEIRRLRAYNVAAWRKWGPYVSERQWGT